MAGKLNDTARLALLKSWIREIQAKKHTKAELISWVAYLNVELSCFKNAIPTLEEQILRDSILKSLVPSAGGRGKSAINEQKRAFVHDEWMKWKSSGKVVGRYKTSFVHHILDLFNKKQVIDKYGDPFHEKYINKLCLQWEKE